MACHGWPGTWPGSRPWSGVGQARSRAWSWPGRILCHHKDFHCFGWFWPLLAPETNADGPGWSRVIRARGSTDRIFKKMAVVGPETRPDGPRLSRESVFWPDPANRSRPGQFRPTFGPWPKVPPAKNLIFALSANIRFMGPSWLRAHGLIFKKVYIVWVCAPGYKPLSCRRNRIRENRT